MNVIKDILKRNNLSVTGSREKILGLFFDQSGALAHGDIERRAGEKFMKGYWENDSLMFIGKSGVTYGYKNTLNNYKKNYPTTADMGKLLKNRGSKAQ